MLTGQLERTSYQIVKDYWASQHKGADFEAWWRSAVHDGVVPDTALPAKTVAVRAGWHGALPPAGHRRRAWKWFSAPTRRYTTAASPTTDGCRSGRDRSLS